MRNRFGIRFAAVLLTAATVVASSPAVLASRQDAAAAPAAAVRRNDAAQTKVALLPVLNLSGEKDEKQRRDQTAKAEEELRRAFEGRGFVLVETEAVRRALEAEKVDLADEEFHNRATLYRVGRAAGADLVAFVLITDVSQRRTQTPLTDLQELVGSARTKTWLLDVAAERPLLSARAREAQAKNNLFAGLDSGARLIRNAVAGAVRDTLRDALSEYPKVAGGATD
jgi:hypothetical protein